jgi:hypothetical protein
MKKLDRFFALWALVLPITSIVVVPGIQGTTPGYLMAFLSLPLALIFRPKPAARLVHAGILFTAAFIVLTMLAQAGLVLSDNVDISELRLVNAFDGKVFLRHSLFTQSLYLLAGIFTFVFTRTFYRPSWNRFILLGAVILAVYGLYEFAFYLLFHESGDFLSNRTFDAGSGAKSGSLFQTFTVAEISIMRLKSLTGEPSMYAFTVLPFWIYAVHNRRLVSQILLLASLLLTFTTTAVLGLSVYFLARLWFLRTTQRFLTGKLDRYLVVGSASALLLAVVAWPIVTDFVREMILEKLTFNNLSGMQRIEFFGLSLEFFLTAPLPNQLFGIGFGYIRSTDFLSTLLVNTGLIGFLLFTGLFLYPILKLDNRYVNVGLKSALIVIYVTMMIAVPEFAYLSVWLFLGISYNVVRNQRKAAHALSN